MSSAHPKEHSSQRRGDAEENIKEEDEIKTGERRGGRGRGGSAAALGARALMPHSFPISGQLHKLWGGPPGQRGTPSSRSGLEESSRCIPGQADQGVGCGPGGPPHNSCRTRSFRKLCGIGLVPLRPLPPQRPLRFDFEFGFSQRLSVSAVNLCGEMVIS
jgi:hypothetical protein